MAWGEVAAALAALARVIWGACARFAPTIIAQLLLTFGLTIAVNHYAGNDVKAMMQGLFNGLAPTVAQLVGYVKFDKAVTVILSAVAVKIATSVALRAKPPAS